MVIGTFHASQPAYYVSINYYAETNVCISIPSPFISRAEEVRRYNAYLAHILRPTFADRVKHHGSVCDSEQFRNSARHQTQREARKSALCTTPAHRRAIRQLLAA